MRRSALPDSGISDAAFHCIKASPKKLLPLTLFGIAVTSLFSVQPVQAGTMTLEQVGANVVANGSGAINLTGLSFDGFVLNDDSLEASSGAILAGSRVFGVAYAGSTGPTTFGSGGIFVADTSSGDPFGTIPNNIVQRLLVVPLGYVSGTALSSSATWNNETFASLGVTPATYEWTWGTGLPNQNFTLIIGRAGVPDGGSTVSLLGCALLGLATLRRKLSC